MSILIVAEKPSVGRELAGVVGAREKKEGYISGGGYIVTWAVGHLTELAAPEMYDEKLKTWKLETLPVIPGEFKTVVSKKTSDQYKIIKELMSNKDITEIICATDAGREGELIFRRIYEKAGCRKPVKRLWVSSMEYKAIKQGLDAMKDWNEYDNLYHAADCRQKADWLVGINLTRMYSVMHGRTLNTGRVQTPTLALIVNRQETIENFKPETYFALTADLGSFLAYAKVSTKNEAEDIAEKSKGTNAVVKSAEKQKKRENPPPLYDLTALQRDANRFFGVSAQQTLDNMQNMYERQLVTYPRTDSRYITSDMETPAKSLMENLLSAGVYDDMTSKKYNREKINVKQIVNDKKVSDHHAILPTAKVTAAIYENLSPVERKLMTLVIYRLIISVYTAHVYMATKAALDITGVEFTATGKEILDYGYRTVEEKMKSALKANPENAKRADSLVDVILPEMKEGDVFPVQNMTYEEKQTQPPRPYTEDTLLSAMETAGKAIDDAELREAMKDSGLGTPATRASIIEHIIKCGYMNREAKNLVPTQAGRTYISLVTGKVKEPEMTAEWEKQLAEIQKGKLSGEVFMKAITDFLNEIIGETKNKPQSENGGPLFAFTRETAGVCPSCGKKVLDNPKCYSCESGKNGCGFVIWKKIAGKTISLPLAKVLLSKGKSRVLKGFKSKAGKPFEAMLAITEKDGVKQVSFEFAGNAAQTNKEEPQ
ncbi:MAG: DNA topoisomerase 3 [Oscillospiraceae bacterium]|nr:DNA topoisomerase 3 [Oscillospiraceae bacterium]